VGSDLKQFLSHKRLQIAPASMGLNGGRKRRTAGLTREDMAELTGVSFRWYTQFESGAAKGVSRKFAERVATVFNLTAAERHYLWTLLGFVDAPPSDPPKPTAALNRLLHAPHGMAMALYSPLFDVIQANAAYFALFPPAGVDDPFATNKLWRMFLEPGFRDTWVDWELIARRVVVDFRFMSRQASDVLLNATSTHLFRGRDLNTVQLQAIALRHASDAFGRRSCRTWASSKAAHGSA
jgi:transcriptional regulator with XRE-family HTH domain